MPGVGFQPNVPWLSYAAGPGGCQSETLPFRSRVPRKHVGKSRGHVARLIIERDRRLDRPTCREGQMGRLETRPRCRMAIRDKISGKPCARSTRV